jgi:thymidylate kinase
MVSRKDDASERTVQCMAEARRLCEKAITRWCNKHAYNYATIDEPMDVWFDKMLEQDMAHRFVLTSVEDQLMMVMFPASASSIVSLVASALAKVSASLFHA